MSGRNNLKTAHRILEGPKYMLVEQQFICFKSSDQFQDVWLVQSQRQEGNHHVSVFLDLVFTLKLKCSDCWQKNNQQLFSLWS